MFKSVLGTIAHKHDETCMEDTMRRRYSSTGGRKRPTQSGRGGKPNPFVDWNLGPQKWRARKEPLCQPDSPDRRSCTALSIDRSLDIF